MSEAQRAESRHEGVGAPLVARTDPDTVLDELRRLAVGAVFWRFAGTVVTTFTYPEPGVSALLLLTGVSLAYNAGVLLALHRRVVGPTSTGFWWCDLAVTAATVVAAAALSPPGTFLLAYYDPLWVQWVALAGLWTVLRGVRVGLLLAGAGAPLQVLMATIDQGGIPGLDLAVVAHRVGFVMITVVLVAWVFHHALRSALALRDAGHAAGVRRGLSHAAEERERMHDLLHGEALGALATIRRLARTDHDPDTMLDRVGDLAQHSEQRLRRRIAALSEPAGAVLDELRDIVDRAADRHPEVHYRLVVALAAGEPVALSSSAHRALASAVEEACSNAGLHADAREVHLVVRRDDDRLVVVVRDDGRGFPPDEVEPRGTVHRIREPIASAGGDVHLETGPAHGTRWVLQVPWVAHST